ncbi:HK97 gp10 family phage protein [Endozoicomonas gorgoniicola]|uniref:HK97 gp10 family phage protein n=1 Tax=Endozoicomonas gorgoniicola TaxID=1234144 RepID=A0ABT3MT03_9GAMM|nr:HK97 gp10 family phage protein [Endozoicomonas gorgoniicola]MCW7552134.1 HK97 gp10 family phage protein [Endozoicomonas gorgoniicola]
MIQLNVNLSGLKELEKQLRELSGPGSIAGAKVLRSAMMSTSLPLFRQIQRTAPISAGKPRKRKSKKGTVEIRPGFLKHKIRRRSYINKTGHGNRNISGSGLVKIRIGGFAPYTHFVEYGTDYGPRHPFTIAPQPFIRPAFDAHWRGLLNNFSGILAKRLASARKRMNR